MDTQIIFLVFKILRPTLLLFLVQIQERLKYFRKQSANFSSISFLDKLRLEAFISKTEIGVDTNMGRKPWASVFQRIDFRVVDLVKDRAAKGSLTRSTTIHWSLSRPA